MNTVRTNSVATALSILLFFSCSSARDPVSAITLTGRLNTPVVSVNGGTVYLQMTVATPDIVSHQRRPLNLSVVLDRSGSMGDDRKIEYAKKALNKLIDQLNSEDILSIVIYDDVVEVLREAEPVGRDKYAIRRLVERVYPRGSTNLGGGMVEGFREVEHHLSKEYVNRVVLLSDGLANQGITEPRELARIARRYRSKCISLSTMGVGLDYNENLMVALAENGGGNYYFIENPNAMASILNKEFNTLSSLVAQNVSIELSLGERVAVRDVVGCDYHSESGHYAIPVGDLYSGEQRDFTVELLLPPGTGSPTVVSGILRYEATKPGQQEGASFSCRVTYTRELALIEKKRDLDVQARVDIAVSTRTVDKAMRSLDEGKTDEAAHLLQMAKSSLSASPAASVAGGSGAALREQAERLDSYQKLLKDSPGDSRKAKKAIQYENYKTQKSKN